MPARSPLIMILANFANSAAQTENRTLIANDLYSRSEIMAVCCKAPRVRRPLGRRVNYRGGFLKLFGDPDKSAHPVVNTDRKFLHQRVEHLMGKINWNRVILGGLVAGVIINIFEF